MITEELLRMLRTYEDGPRIWDATSLTDRVYRLEELGLTEQVAGSAARRLTARGREVLEQSR